MRTLTFLLLILFLNCTNDVSSPEVYSLNLAILQPNAGEIITEMHDDGKTITITVIPAEGRTFHKWSGDYTTFDSSLAYDSSITFMLDSDKAFYADVPYFVFDTGKVVIRDVPDTILAIGDHALFSLDLNLTEDLNYLAEVTLPNSYNSLYYYNLNKSAKNINVGSYPNIDGVDSAIAGETDWFEVKIKDYDKDSLLYKYRFDYNVKWE